MSNDKAKEALEALYVEGENEAEEPLHLVLHLKRRMAERGLTQTQLSEMSGVRQATISQMSRGNVEKIHVPTLEKLARAMNITDIRQLLTFEMESEIMSPTNPFDVDYEYKTNDI